MASSIITSIVTGGSNSHATTSAEANAPATDFFSQGCVGTIANTAGVAPSTGAFAVNAQGTPAMLVDVTAGVAWISATPSGQPAQLLRAYMSATYTSYAITANSSGSTKYDWVYLSVDATKAGGTEDAAADDVTTLFTSRSSSNTADNGSPPTYGILLAVITVANGASSITNANIADARSNALPASTSLGWIFSTNTYTFTSYTSATKTGVIAVPSDATLRHSAGQRVRFYNNGSLQYGIITAVASTSLTVYFGTDYSLTSGPITQPAYSYQKAPTGFPLDPIKWTQTYTYSDDSTTTSATYAQVGSHQLSIPIGSWDVLHKGTYEIITAGANISTGHVALSTATNSVSDAELGHTFSNNEISSIAGTLLWPFFNRKVITVTTPTIYYQIFARDSALTHGVIGSKDTGYIKAICAYL